MAEINSLSLLSDANLKAYYRFESGALTTDTSPSGYTLTNNGTITGATGKFGEAADFGTANSTKYFSRTDEFGTTNGGAQSVSLWVKMRTEISANFYYLFATGFSASHVEFLLGYDYNAGTRRLIINRSKFNVGNQIASYNVTMGTTNWYHVGYTYDGSTLRLYVNGIEQNNIAASGTGNSSTYSDYGSIGARKRATTDNYSNAYIDDVAVFNRELTSGEMLTIYNDAVTLSRTSSPMFFSGGLALA